MSEGKSTTVPPPNVRDAISTIMDYLVRFDDCRCRMSQGEREIWTALEERFREVVWLGYYLHLKPGQTQDE